MEHDSRAEVALSQADRKRFSDLQAIAALAGFEVNALVDVETGAVTFQCQRWQLSRELDGLDEVQAWLRRAGVGVPE